MIRAAGARALVACLALGACSTAPIVVPTTTVAVPGESRPGVRLVPVPIDNFGVVADGIYRGAQPGRAGWESLRELGVKTVVNLREHHSDSTEAWEYGFEDVSIPMRADVFGSRAPSEGDIERFLDLLTAPARRPVFVHCGSGSDRTGVMFAIYRLEVEGWTRERALDEMESHGFHNMYKTLERFVRAYEVKGKWRAPLNPSSAPGGPR